MAVENHDRSSPIGFIRRCDPVLVFISQEVMLLPALPLMIWEVAR